MKRFLICLWANVGLAATAFARETRWTGPSSPAATARKLEAENAALQQSLAELKALVLKLAAAQPGQ